VSTALFRLRLDDGGVVLAAGDPEHGPERLLPAGASLDGFLSGTGPGLDDALASATTRPVPLPFQTLAPVASQEICAAGVTYRRSRDARIEEAADASPYDRVYDAPRPELFAKCAGWRARGHGQPIGIRRDSPWNVPEPELGLVIDARGHIVGFTIGNDVSSRSIEGENPLYLPQAKTYDGACALGPAIVPASSIEEQFDLSMQVDRDGDRVFEGATSTSALVRTLDELAAWLFRALTFPAGAVLLTGTGIVPDADFTLQAGDVVSIECPPLGTLRNPVIEVGDPGG
jgi:2-dehydro-3-deoxy-D-arabinonate dehydratase